MRRRRRTPAAVIGKPWPTPLLASRFHFLRVRIPDMAARAQDEFAAVLGALPLRNHLYVDALLDAAIYEHTSQ